MTDDARALLADQFETHRPHLRAVAYRMLGSVDEADDALQETWLRLNRSDADAIDNLGGWLTTVDRPDLPRHAALAAGAPRGSDGRPRPGADHLERRDRARSRSRRCCSPTRSGWPCSWSSRR